MTINKCILTDAVLTEENDSKAHILPSALGGRFKPKGILSKKANETLNDKFDLPLIHALSPFMALLGGARDRGENKPVRMTDKSGQSYSAVFGKPLKLAEPKFQEKETPDGRLYRITARTIKEARTLLGRVKKNHPELDIEQAINQAEVRESYVDGMLRITLNIGPNVFFPAAFAISSVFAATKEMKIHSEFKAYVENFEPSSPPDEPEETRVVAIMPPDTFYWIPSRTWFKTIAEVSHVLVYFGDPTRKQALFYLELFNLPGIAVVMPYDESSTVIHTYGVDVLDGKEIGVYVDEIFLQSASWEATHTNGDEELFKLGKLKVEKLIGLVHSRSQSHEIERILEQELGSPEDVKKISERIARFILNNTQQSEI